MTEAEQAIVRAIEALQLPAHLVNEAGLVILAGEHARQDLLARLTENVRSSSRLEGSALEAYVSACIMLASLRLMGRLPAHV